MLSYFTLSYIIYGLIRTLCLTRLLFCPENILDCIIVCRAASVHKHTDVILWQQPLTKPFQRGDDPRRQNLTSKDGHRTERVEWLYITKDLF